MKQRLLTIFLVLFAISLSSAQAWMTNLEIAQRLALVQNKMILMVWEETTSYEYPVLVKDEKGRTIFVNNLFEDEYISPLIWEHFVPVIVSEHRYADLYEKIKGKRSQKYIDKFNDDTIKILDAEEIKDREALRQRCDLLEMQEFLILRRPKKVIRALKKIAEEDIAESNKSFVAFLYYTAYLSMDKYKDAEAWKSKISSLNLAKAQKIINLNT